MTKRIEPSLRRNLLKLARAYAKAKGVTLVTVAQHVHGDSPFFVNLARVRTGKNVKTKFSFSAWKYDQVVEQFIKRWPANTKWPELEKDARRPEGV